MHICFISSEYPLWKSGGVGSFLQTLGRALVKEGHMVSIVGIGNKEEQLDDKGVQIYRLPVSKVPIGKFLFNTNAISKKINELNKDAKIDIVESAELGLAFLIKNPSIKYVIRLHGGHHFFAESENRKIHWWQGLKEKLSFKKADGFIAVSMFVKEYTAKYLSYNNKRVEVIYSPINTDLFSPMDSIKKDADNITFVGTICEKKGIRQLILALELVAKKYPNIKLNIFGREWFYKDGRSYTKMLQDKYKELIEKHVIFHGVIPFEKLPEKYALANVCAFPSHMETQGLVAQEAMAMEKPVVFTKLGPGKETIRDYETGLLCNPYDINDIAEKIIWYLDNEDKHLTIGTNARKFVLDTFNVNSSIYKNISFYKSLIEY
ncbi:glycosyltransferase family 4 protein [Winogradskyella vincentii]|uniref:Glycosyltransferase family 4 protein n=1 Tax=Winogradskyella vincentii TaxID=2877122 RepID=A0ABS7Y1B0_9FLAO|nr:glycosyltransferase family 4 protein [Winogradskyella vincentii]MCA0153709.1 glycosyltransferase family 4 protein [Winogradskyella vincentii]